MDADGDGDGESDASRAGAWVADELQATLAAKAIINNQVKGDFGTMRNNEFAPGANLPELIVMAKSRRIQV